MVVDQMSNTQHEWSDGVQDKEKEAGKVSARQKDWRV